MSVPGRSPWRVLLISAATLVAACSAATPTASPPGPTAAPPTPVATPGPSDPGPSDQPSAGPSLLIEVTSEGGFINPVVTLGAVPQVVVDDNGRVYTPAPDAMLNSGDSPLIPHVDVRDLGSTGATAIADAIRAAGLDHEHDNVGVAADAGVTVFTVVLNGVEIVNRFTLGGGRPGGPGLPGGLPGVPGANGPADPTPDPAAAAAFALLARLTDPSETWGAPEAGSTTYEPVAYRVYAAPGATPAESGSAAPVPAWPLATGLDAFGTAAVPDLGLAGLRTGIVQGPDAAALASQLGPLPAGSVVASGGGLWQLWIRPLLPDEVGA
jgi:hypothetical protein